MKTNMAQYEYTKENQLKYENLAKESYKEFKRHKGNMEKFSKEFVFFRKAIKERNRLCAELMASTEKEYLEYSNLANSIRGYFLGEYIYSKTTREVRKSVLDQFFISCIKNCMEETEENLENFLFLEKIEVGYNNLDKYNLRFTVESEDK